MDKERLEVMKLLEEVIASGKPRIFFDETLPEMPLPNISFTRDRVRQFNENYKLLLCSLGEIIGKNPKELCLLDVSLFLQKMDEKAELPKLEPSISLSRLEEICKEAKKKHIYFYNHEDDDDGYVEGLTENYKEIPLHFDVIDVAVGYNQALADLIKRVKGEK